MRFWWESELTWHKMWTGSMVHWPWKSPINIIDICHPWMDGKICSISRSSIPAGTVPIFNINTLIVHCTECFREVCHQNKFIHLHKNHKIKEFLHYWISPIKMKCIWMSDIELYVKRYPSSTLKENNNSASNNIEKESPPYEILIYDCRNS